MYVLMPPNNISAQENGEAAKWNELADELIKCQQRPSENQSEDEITNFILELFWPNFVKRSLFSN